MNSRGVILFAFNSKAYDYYAMAQFTAKRINYYLNLPVTLVTDQTSIPSTINYAWDKILYVEPDRNNFRDWGQWINKGRYMAYYASPYDETILLDVDYVVNSGQLLRTFDMYDDFMCHNKTSFIMYPNAPQEFLSAYSYETLWATVVTFKKTKRVEKIFDCLEMIQKNYEHYANIHSFIHATYRNDYALTLALKIVNGHLDVKSDYIPWNLLHAGKDINVISNNPNDLYNNEFTVMFDNWQRGKIKKEYITLKNQDFHMMDKAAFLRFIPND